MGAPCRLQFARIWGFALWFQDFSCFYTEKNKKVLKCGPEAAEIHGQPPYPSSLIQGLNLLLHWPYFVKNVINFW